MMLAKVIEEFIVFIGHYVVIADSAADKNSFNSGKRTKFAENFKIFAVVRNKIGAGSGRKAFFACAKSELFLFFTGRSAEVCGRAAYVMDISFEIGMSGQLFCLF